MAVLISDLQIASVSMGVPTLKGNSESIIHYLGVGDIVD